MRVSGISTPVMQNTTRSSIQQIQNELRNAQIELSTGRRADVGASLGIFVTRNIDWRDEISRLRANVLRNESLSDQANVTQITLEAIKGNAENLLSTLSGARSAQNGAELAYTSSRHNLKSIIETLSTTVNSKYVYGGQTSTTSPIKDYEGGPAQLAFDSAFLTTFGFAKTDPQAQTIPRAQWQQFVDGPMQALFEEPSWSTNWSNSVSPAQTARLAGNNKVELGATANETAFKQILKASTLAMESGQINFSQDTFQRSMDLSVGLAATAMQGLGNVQARIGFGQQAIERTNAKMLSQITILEKAVTDTETVSEFEAATNLNSLSTRLEASFTITGRLARLSLLNFI